MSHWLHSSSRKKVCVCLPGAVLLQFEDMNRLSVAGGTEELGVCAEGQRTDADVPDG